MAGVLFQIMNNKTKTMFVVQPGGFGSGTAIFSSYEFENDSLPEVDFAPLADRKPVTVSQTIKTRSWTQSVSRLPKAFHRSVWQPLTRRVLKLGTAA